MPDYKKYNFQSLVSNVWYKILNHCRVDQICFYILLKLICKIFELKKGNIGIRLKQNILQWA